MEHSQTILNVYFSIIIYIKIIILLLVVIVFLLFKKS